MTFNRLFYDDQLNFGKFFKFKILFFLCISVFSALVFYSFSQVIFETERLISFSFQVIPNIISEGDRNFYNFFFASISLLLGHSIAVNYLFSTPSNLMSRRSISRKRIVNEQIFLSFNFAHWFTKIAWMFGTFAMCCVDMEFSSTTRCIAVLLIIVLYLELWKTLKRVFNNKKWKYMCIHALLFCCLSYGFSKINIIDYKAIDRMALKTNPIVDLPESFFNHSLDWRSVMINFKILQNDNGELIIKNQYNEDIIIQDIANEIMHERSSLREELQSRFVVRISADKSVKLVDIKQIEVILFSIGQRRIEYNVYNEDPLTRSFKQIGIRHIITYDILQFRPNEVSFYPPIPDRIFNELVYKDTLNVYIENSIRINDLEVPKSMLINKLETNISRDKLINYRVSKQSTFQNYITVLSAHYKAANKLREKVQIVKDPYGSRKAYVEEQYELKCKFPINTKETYTK